jgi:hypothetical protein
MYLTTKLRTFLANARFGITATLRHQLPFFPNAEACIDDFVDGRELPVPSCSDLLLVTVRQWNYVIFMLLIQWQS